MNKLEATKEKEYLITREDFMKETGVFISPLYYECIYEDELEKLFNKGLSKDEVIKKWLYENESLIVETEFNEKFKYLFEDDTVCAMDIEKPTALDIISWLTEYHDNLLLQRDEARLQRNDTIEKYDELILMNKKLIRLIELLGEELNILLAKFQKEISNDSILYTRLYLLASDVINTCKDEKLLITKDEYRKAELFTKDEEE